MPPVYLPSSTVFRDVSKSLQQLISSKIQDLPDGVITFESPGQIAGNRTMLAIFLYRVTTDPYTVNQVPTIREENGVFYQYPPPQALNLNYIMVPYSPDAETELVIADQLRNLFYNISSLKGNDLQGSLKVTGNEQINIVANDPPMEKIHNLWTGFSQRPYRLSLFYDLVPIFIPSQNKRPVSMTKLAQIGKSEIASR